MNSPFPEATEFDPSQVQAGIVQLNGTYVEDNRVIAGEKAQGGGVEVRTTVGNVWEPPRGWGWGWSLGVLRRLTAAAASGGHSLPQPLVASRRAVTCRHMPSHAVACRHMLARATTRRHMATRRHVPLHAVSRCHAASIPACTKVYSGSALLDHVVVRNCRAERAGGGGGVAVGGGLHLTGGTAEITSVLVETCSAARWGCGSSPHTPSALPPPMLSPASHP